MTEKVYRSEREGSERHDVARMAELANEMEDALNSAREIAAMYLQCLNSRALENGETVEQVAAFCKQEFEENPWLEAEYKKLAEMEAGVKAFCEKAGLR